MPALERPEPSGGSRAPGSGRDDDPGEGGWREPPVPSSPDSLTALLEFPRPPAPLLGPPPLLCSGRSGWTSAGTHDAQYPQTYWAGDGGGSRPQNRKNVRAAETREDRQGLKVPRAGAFPGPHPVD